MGCKLILEHYRRVIAALTLTLGVNGPSTVHNCNFAGERERRRDDLLALQKSKQERTDAELTHIRMVSIVSLVLIG